MIISVDHGNKSIKTPNALFTSGLIVSEGLQGFKTDYICWNNKYYTLTEQRIAYLRDKTEDERFYVLTLFAIAKELERRKVPETLDTLGPNSVYGSRRLWLENGGSNTYRELLYVCSLAERSRIIHFLSTLPDHFDVEVGDRKFHLVHAMPSDDPDDRIWRRPKPDDPPYFEDRIAVVGHTPTCYMSGDMESPFAVWHGNGLIDIDCGCGNKTELRRLACLRLDDLKEFYI